MTFSRNDDSIGSNQGTPVDQNKQDKVRLALVESESRYRTLAESARDYIFIINKDDKVEYINEHALDLFKASREELIGASRECLFGPDSNNVQKKNLQKVFETGESLHQQEWIVLRNGENIFLDTRLVPIKKDDRVQSVLGIARDLTEQKIAEEKAIDRERKYHTLFDTIHNPILLMDGDKIIDCNKASMGVFNLTKDAIMGQCVHSFFSKPDLQKKAVELFIKEKIDLCLSGKSQHFEMDYVQSSKERLNCEIHLTRFPDSERWHTLAVVRNITQYKKANEAIRASEARFRDIIGRSNDGYYFVDVNYRITHLNKAGERILTYTKEEFNDR